MSVSEYRETLTPSGERPSRVAMSGMLIKGPKRLSRYSSVVMCKFAVSGEGLRILVGYWRIVKLTNVLILPIYSILVSCFIRFGSRGLVVLVSEVRGGRRIRPMYIRCLSVIVCIRKGDYKNSRLFLVFFIKTSHLEILSSFPTRSSARRWVYRLSICIDL